jgi:D-glycero-D-manno-heptose 1,7-bisphosphate phosphatase
MLLRAAAEWNIDLSASYMVGDTEADVQTARNAGCRPVLLAENTNDPRVSDAQVFRDLLQFAETL